MPRSEAVFENLFYVSTPMENADHLQRRRVGSIDDRIRVDRPYVL